MKLSEQELQTLLSRHSPRITAPVAALKPKQAVKAVRAVIATPMLDSLVLDMPLRIRSEQNQRENWRTVHRQKKAQQKEVNAEWRKAARGRMIRLPCVVTLTRIGCNLLDDDGLRAGFKFVRDEIASLLGVDDSPSSPVQFRYHQTATGTRKYRVLIEVQSVGRP